MWSEPKIDWKSADFYNIEDWQRIRSNLEHIRTWFHDNGWAELTLLETETGRGYAELPYVHLANNMETNLATLRQIFGVDFTEDVAQRTWYDRLDSMYTSNPTCNDWNRWELVLLRVYESIQYIEAYVFAAISGACRSGSDRTVIRFSRGR